MTTTDCGAALAAVAENLRRRTVRVHDAAEHSGAGVAWEASGAIVTNAHVVQGREALVELSGGLRARAVLVARDRSADLALLRIVDAEPALARIGHAERSVRASQSRATARASVSGAPALDLRAARSLVPGEIVVAVGHPLGLVGALCTGLVQRANAKWVVADVRLAPGNSGGPLADAAGRIVGINSMIVGGRAIAVASETVADFVAGALSRTTRAA